MKSVIIILTVISSFTVYASSPKKLCKDSVIKIYGKEIGKTFKPQFIINSEDLRGTVTYSDNAGNICDELIRCRASNNYQAQAVDIMCEGQD